MTENKKRVLSFVFLAAFIALFMMTVAFSVGVTTSRLSAFAEININVKDSTDTTVIFSTLEPTDTVGDLKALVAASNELGTPAVEEQMLVFGGHLLADADTLQDYSIQNNSTLHLMLFSGQGTEADPYLIDTKYHLIKFRDIVNGSNGETQNTDAWAILTANIDLENQAWTPIGNDTDRYAGTFDGAGYTISGLNVNDSTLDNAGLFGVIDGGEGNGMAIKDLTLEGSIVGGTNTGSIAGTAYNFDILYCCNNAAVSGLKKVGGFIGYSRSGFSMRYCYNSAAVSATDSSVNFVGGIVGLNSVGEYEDCYNTGAVTASLASGQAGGIAGSMSSSGLIARCYNVGIVSGGDNGSSGSNSGVVLASYSPLRQTTEDNYYLENTALSSNGAVSGLTAAEFGDSESFNNWDFDTVWVISYDSVLSMSRPYLFHTYVKYHDKDGSGVVLRQPRTILGKTGILDPVIIQDLSENPAAGKEGYTLVGWATTNGGAQAYTFNDYYYGAELDLYPVYSAIPAVAASITTQPSDPDLRYGYTSGSISVVATPDGGTEYALSYQWYSNTSESSVAGTEIVGATSDVYNIPTGYGTGSTHYYYCVVTATRQDNGETANTTSNPVTVTVNPRPITVTYTATCVYEATYLDMDSWVALGTTMGENDYFFVVSNQVNTDPLFYDPTSGQDNGILNLDYYNAEADFYLWDRDDIDYALYLCEAGTYDFVVSLHNNNYVLESPIVLGQYAKIIINPWIITITPDGGQGKTYGENDTVITYSVSEAAPGEEIVLNGGALSYSGGSNAGDHPITLGSLALTNDPVNANYELEIADVKYTIGKRTLSLININEEPVRFTYDENPMYLLHQFLTWGGEHFKADGQVGSLFAIVDGSVAEADDFIEAFTVLPYREESEGRVYLTDLIFSESYANEIVTGIWQFEFREEGNNNNYSLTTSFDNNFKGNILQKPIYFTPDDAEKEYGQEDGAIALIDAYKYMYAGLNPYGPFVETVINSDDDDFYDDLLYDNLFDLSTSIGLSFSREEGENVGTYTINDLSCSSFGSGFSANYGAAMGALATFTINKAAATIAVAPSAKAGLVYDGTYQELVTAGSGVVGGTLKYRVGDGMWTTDLPAERNATSSESGYTVYYKVEPDGNHTGDIQGTLENITIAKRPITVRYTSGHKYVTYKDEASWAVLSEEMSPPNDLHLVIDNMAQENDGIFAVLYIDFLDENGLFVYGDRHMYDMFNLEAGAYEMVATLSNSNYELTEPIDVSAFRLYVLPRVITVTPDENQGKIYGDNDTTITYTVDYGNVLLGDEVALNDGALSYSEGSYAGVHPITLGNLALTDDAVNANYELVLSETPVLYTIAPKSIAGAEITLGTALTYNGNAQTQTVSSVALDDFDLTYTVTGNIGTNAGEYILTVSGTGNFTGSETKAWSIGKKSISGAVITLGNALIYNGDEQTQEVVSVVVDDLSATYTVTENTGTDTGNYTLTVTGTGNYTGTVTKEFGIGKKALTITANDKVVTYGDAPANGGVTYAGFVTGQDETILTGTLAYACLYEQFGRAGEYDITVSGLTGDNYAITYVAGTLRVNKKAVEIGISPVVAIEGNVPDPATTITGLLNGDTATVIVRYSLGETVLTEKPTTAGAYVATAILAEANYVAESKQANFVVKATVVEAPVEDTEEDTPVSISSDDGFDPNAELVVRKLWSGEQEYKAVSDYVATNERIAGVYDVKLLLGGTPVHIDEPVTVRMRIPETMIGKEFSLVNLSGSVAERIDYTVEGNYVVITTSTLDQFAFVYAEGDGAFTPDLTWLYILLGVLGGCMLIAAIIIFVLLKKKKDEEKKKALERKAEE